ncbi:MAG: hypothetical protein ABEJ72_10085, partial [Candidatus Aenigmatarchaeota archaeon]
MDKKILGLIALVAISLLLTGNANAADRGLEISFDTQLIKTNPIPVESGEDAKVYFKVRNTGDLTVENFTLKILDSFPFR